MLRMVLPLLVLSACGDTAVEATSVAPTRIAAHEHQSFVGEEVLSVMDPEIFGIRGEFQGEYCCLIPGGGGVSSIALTAQTFQDLLPSWNVHLQPGASFTVDIAVAAGESERSPWMRIGEWGAVHEDAGTTEFAGGKVAIDVFQGTQDFDRWWWRLQTYGGSARIDAFHAILTDHEGRGLERVDRGLASGTVCDHVLAPRSQRLEDARIAGRICSPTSVAMSLAHCGAEHTTAEIAALLFDARNDIYGNWNRAIQGAYALGIPGWLDRFADWDRVHHHLRNAGPLVISIGYGSGELTGAPLDETKGHLIVLCGLDGRGGVTCMDPAAPTLETVRRTYSAQELERAWMERSGVAYVFHPPTQGGR